MPALGEPGDEPGCGLEPVHRVRPTARSRRPSRCSLLGCSRSVSIVPGAPTRTSTAASVGGRRYDSDTGKPAPWSSASPTTSPVTSPRPLRRPGRTIRRTRGALSVAQRDHLGPAHQVRPCLDELVRLVGEVEDAWAVAVMQLVQVADAGDGASGRRRRVPRRTAPRDPARPGRGCGGDRVAATASWALLARGRKPRPRRASDSGNPARSAVSRAGSLWSPRSSCPRASSSISNQRSITRRQLVGYARAGQSRMVDVVRPLTGSSFRPRVEARASSGVTCTRRAVPRGPATALRSNALD